MYPELRGIAETAKQLIGVTSPLTEVGMTVTELAAVLADSLKFKIKPDVVNKALVVSVQEEMLKAGMAYHYKQYSGNCHNRDVFDTAEDIGRSQKLGVWQLPGGGERPWDYRKQNQS